MSIGKSILGALGGFAAGAIAGMLFAPEKVSETGGSIMEAEDVHVRPRIAKLIEPVLPIAEQNSSTKHLTELFNNAGKANYEKPKNENNNGTAALRNWSTHKINKA